MIGNVRANFGTRRLDKHEIAVGKVKAEGKTSLPDLWRATRVYNYQADPGVPMISLGGGAREGSFTPSPCSS